MAGHSVANTHTAHADDSNVSPGSNTTESPVPDASTFPSLPMNHSHVDVCSGSANHVPGCIDSPATHEPLPGNSLGSDE